MPDSGMGHASRCKAVEAQCTNAAADRRKVDRLHIRLAHLNTLENVTNGPFF